MDQEASHASESIPLTVAVAVSFAFPVPLSLTGRVDIKAYYPATNPQGFLSEAQEENPGWYINVNWDDDDGDGWTEGGAPPNAQYTPDKDDPYVHSSTCTEDDDLWMFTVEITPFSIHGDVRLTFQDNVKVYTTRTKKMGGEGSASSGLSSGSTVYFGGSPITLYMEGRSGTASFRGVELNGTCAVPNVAPDRVLVTVFEVELHGLFQDAQQKDNSARHSAQLPLPGSNDMNGKISWNDANGDGVTGDADNLCRHFHNCMETQGTVKPANVTTQATFDFRRKARGKTWEIMSGSDWQVEQDWSATWHEDSAFDSAKDLTPSPTNHIYEIDGLGWNLASPPPTHAFMSYNMREFATVTLYGRQYQCSNFYTWHHQLYVKPSPGHPLILWRAGAVPQLPLGAEWAQQKLGEGWLTVPSAPPAP